MRWRINQTQSNHQSILDTILQQRGLTTPKLIHDFLNPATPATFDLTSLGVSQSDLRITLTTINQAISQQQSIIIYGDYDADGITATAILWETLHHLGAKAIPFIPSRELHGYGLSIKGLEDALKLTPQTPLIITVDNGIVAHDQAEWLRKQGIPLIITDHHTPATALPQALAVIHTQAVSGAGIAWLLSNSLDPVFSASTLDLVSIGTIADMMPLTGINRSFALHGLSALSHTTRPGLTALLAQATISNDQSLSPYHIGYIIAPRLNAMGRLDHALDSLRLICTLNLDRAQTLATKLGATNQTRQDLTVDLLNQALDSVKLTQIESLIVVDSDNYHEGVIGLIAGKLVETFYRPAIVISKKDQTSKASARSIKGVNITDLIRSQSNLLLGVGGHPMAAGFSIKTSNIDLFKQSIIAYANSHITKELFEPTLDIDCEIDLSDITDQLYDQIHQLEPFGIGNPEPVFALKNVQIDDVVAIGKNGNHQKLLIHRSKAPPLTAIWFNPPTNISIKSGQIVSLAGTINRNTFRNKSTLQLIVKDLVH